MRAVTHSDSPPQSHQHNPSPSGSLHPRRATHDLFKRSSDPSSPLAERLDALIDAFEARISHCADDLRSALNRAFELDDDSRTELTRDAASDRKRIVSRLAVIVQRLKVMFDVVSSDSPSPRLIDAIWNQTLQLAGSAAAIALDTRGVDPVQAFACGAVCNLGQLVLTVQFPKAVERVERALRSGEPNALEVEARICGVDRVAIGAHLLSRWKLPEALQAAGRAFGRSTDEFSDDFDDSRHLSILRDASALATKKSDQRRQADQLIADIQKELLRLMRPSANASNDRRAPRQLQHAAHASAEAGAISMVHLNRFMQQAAELPGRATGVDGLCSETARIVHDFLGVSRMVVFAHVGSREFRTCAFEATSPVADPVVHTGGAMVRTPVTGYARHSIANDHSLRIQNAVSTEYAELSDRFIRLLGPGAIECLALECGTSQPGGILFSADDDGWRWKRLDSASLRALSLMLGTVFESMLTKRRLQLQADSRDDALHAQSLERRALVQAELISRVAQMAAGAAHELNNPLAIVTGRAQMLQSDPKNEAIKSDLQLIAAQARRAGDMVSELMDYARPATPQPTRIWLSDWANRLRQRWYRRCALDADQIQIHLQCDDLVVFADERQLDALADEIMANAVEALRQKNGPCATKSGELPNIQINSPSTPSDDTIVVAISDNGRGMPESVRKHAVDPFFSHREAGRRQGLGLSRAARYVEINGGRLWIESAVGEGTTIRFTLPSYTPQPFDP